MPIVDLPNVNLRGLAFDPSQNDLFVSVSLSGGLFKIDVGDEFGDIAFVGMIGPANAVQGLAIISSVDCYADYNGDGSLDILDFVAFQYDFVNGDINADCKSNGVLNVLDFVCFHRRSSAAADAGDTISPWKLSSSARAYQGWSARGR